MDLNIEFYHFLKNYYSNLWHLENKNYWSNPSTFPLILKLLREPMQEAIGQILNIKASVIGFSVVDPKEHLTIEFIRDLKKRKIDSTIVLGGPACATTQSRMIFTQQISDFIDAFVFSEGEEPLLEIMRRLDEGKSLEDIPGTVTKHDSEWVCVPSGKPLSLHSIPFPTYRQFKVEMYLSKRLFVEWSRGCIGRCAFCRNYRIFPHYRSRPPRDITRELQFHYKENGVRSFIVCDALMNSDLRHLEKVISLIHNNKLDIQWTGHIAPRRDMDENLFKRMREAGCYKLQIGVESGSKKILKLMKRFYTPEDAEYILKASHKAGIENEIFIVVGFPQEGEREFYETVDFIVRNRAFINRINSINTIHLIPGSDIYENSQKYGIILPKENWHYLWYTENGNDYTVRKKRVELLLSKTNQLGIEVLQTNIVEGKENLFDSTFESTFEELKERINNLQRFIHPSEMSEGVSVIERRLDEEYTQRLEKLRKELKEKKEELRAIQESRGWRWLVRIVRIKRMVCLSSIRLVKLPKLTILVIATLIIEAYLILLKRGRKLTIFPE